MPKRPTQADVARLAGVSRATVSYVLNERSGGRVPISEETRHKVLAAAQKLGYEPNALALGLRSGQSYTIGLLMPDVHNPHYLDILDGVEQELAEREYHLAIVSANLDPEQEHRCVRSLFQKRFDGLVFMPTFWDMFSDEIELFSARTSPAVFLIPFDGADWVAADVRCGAEALMDHLLSLGHRRIGFVNGVARRNMTRTRQAVYREKLNAAGLPVDEQLIVHCGPTMQDGYAATQGLLALDRPPTAIWTINDLLAVGALHAIHERGLRIPDDVALAGFDDIALASQLYPPLTTVRMPSTRMGRRAAQILLKRIQDATCEPMQEIINTELVVRQSTDLARQAEVTSMLASR